jgi:hypothetical protein
MKHKAELSISRPSYGDGRRKIAISVTDEDARIKFLEIEIDLDNFAECLTGLSNVQCDMEVRGLHNVGKVIEKDTLEFRLREDSWYNQEERAKEEVDTHVPEGWVASKYFGSKTSFFSKGDERWARTSISRWVDKGDTDVDG